MCYVNYTNRQFEIYIQRDVQNRLGQRGIYRFRFRTRTPQQSDVWEGTFKLGPTGESSTIETRLLDSRCWNLAAEFENWARKWVKAKTI
jgi:hypothetical protein